ncbi:MAG TPA: sugar kinase [Trichocoleus sp.]|jgi:sugar/nucleoside kinase (ribokinase family)
MTAQGLFIGLITLDLLYLTQHFPDRNQKIVALDYEVAAGGPATNAAVTFSYLGGAATLMGVLGAHPIRELILADVQQWGVTIADLHPERPDPPPTSSILVTEATGERAVISLNAVKSQVAADAIANQALSGIEIVLIDGHQITVGQTIARQAKAKQIPVVIDGGSWKPGFERILSEVDYAICSANFQPPGCETIDSVFAYLESLQIPHIAITQGEQPILYRSQGKSGEMAVPVIQPVDTLGAGDIFHGAFCHFILHSEFTEALAQAANIAAQACQQFGTRAWMKR